MYTKKNIFILINIICAKYINLKSLDIEYYVYIHEILNEDGGGRMYRKTPCYLELYYFCIVIREIHALNILSNGYIQIST